MTAEVLNQHRIIWETKPVLRAIYSHYYKKIIFWCKKGRSLEIGGGSGNFKDFKSDVVSTDVVRSPWIDAVADAQSLPFQKRCFSNIVMVDTLHHIEQPRLFLQEAERLLEKGGRIIMIEPAITIFSNPFYNLFHQEPVDLKADPLAKILPDPDRDPFDANQAIPTILCGRELDRLSRFFPTLKLKKVEKFDFLAYPLSGGFRRWSLIPLWSVPSLLKLENFLSPIIGSWAAFRMLAVFEKID